MISENMSYLVEKKLFNKDTRSNHSVAILEAKLNSIWKSCLKVYTSADRELQSTYISIALCKDSDWRI